MSTDRPLRQMTGAELKSMLKSSINFKSLGGLKVPGLKLSEADLQWWRDAKIGLFVHWGLYSILGRGEWVKFNEQLSYNEYDSLADEFIPEDFSPAEWVDLAHRFGAKYMVMVTRHHDGFALWDSPGSYQGFTSANKGAKRDYVSEYTKACRETGMKVGYYYSPMDWRFPGYFDPVGLAENAALMKKQCYEQVEELAKRCPDILWYDGGWLAHKGSDTSSAWFWEPDKLNAMVRQFCPKVVINPRSGWEGDFYCDEGSHPTSGNIIPVPWEKNMCICSGASWGWMENDPVTAFDDLIRMMIDVVCRDGNWLVNIGPDRNGKISPEITRRVDEVGDWLKEYGNSVYGTRGGPVEPVDGVFGTTSKGSTVYIHVLDKDAFSKQTLSGFGSAILSATTFDGKTTIPFQQEDNNAFRFTMPENLQPSVDTILKVILKDEAPTKSDNIYFTGKE
ncbi:MAG: alpha-L-fucosidase [Christensenellales bacterium]|jgi:alpha-L-fucosidase